ncbi:MAG: hypothetical protein EOS65_02580 [Mesorhizobium sp.]|uniref:hypothetical protein n=1 Tax=Mesorhizobium sp. TaxID=1871066 RepID=UPI000FEA4B3D|nr:hypothetical protein [Mesorhizobium sp.]RWF44281.1 MAG: hypothetical protein EOS65_02580 [Mesorhizobium sp.]
MTEMLERVAKAILDEGKNFGALAHRPTGDYSIERRLARAVIEAMREPTKEMVDVGYTEINNNIDSWNYDSGSGYAVDDIAPSATWRAMIDAALGGAKK